jgi:hypothetical protein
MRRKWCTSMSAPSVLSGSLCEDRATMSAPGERRHPSVGEGGGF